MQHIWASDLCAHKIRYKEHVDKMNLSQFYTEAGYKTETQKSLNPVKGPCLYERRHFTRAMHYKSHSLMLQSVTHYEVMLVKSCCFCLTLPLEISPVLQAIQSECVLSTSLYCIESCETVFFP